MNQSPPASDTVARYPINHWGKNYQERKSDTAQWYPHLFSGFPSYGGYINTYGGPIYQLLGYEIFNRGIKYWFHFILSGISMFIFLRWRKIGQISSLFGAFIFTLSPYLFGLINAGHPAKLYAIAYIPFVILAFEYTLKHQTWRGVLYLSIATALQLWTKHIQVVYYTLMLLFFFWGWYQIKALIKKRWSVKREGVQTGILLASLILATFLVLDPYASIYQFQGHSNRGAQSVLDQSKETESGTRWDYATRWSMHPKETISFLFPYFYGLQNYPTRDFKSMAYWGHMPFTQSTHYLGLLTILIAVLGLIVKRPDKEAWSFIIATGLILLIGFGKYFPILFGPLFKFAPFFSKFRVPSMIYVLLPFTGGYLASIGLENILFQLTKGDKKGINQLKNWGFKIFGFVALLSLLVILFGSSLSHIPGFFSHPADVKIQPELLTQVKETRIGIFQKGLLLAFIISTLGFSVIWLGVKKYISPSLFGMFIIFISVIDLWVVDHEFLFLKPSRSLHQHFRKTPIVDFLKKDKDLFRIFPMDNFNTNWYGYFGLPSVGGYRAVKLRTYQDLMDAGGLNKLGILNMLNVKYIITKRNLTVKGFRQVFSDGQKIYENLSVLPKAWWVNEIISVNSQKESLLKTLESNFDPSKTAIILNYQGPQLKIKSDGDITVEKYEENEIILHSHSTSGGLLVLSENYYGPGWKAIVDESNTPIYQTNHILRSVYVPAGEHTITFKYDITLFKMSRLVSRVTFAFLLLGLLFIYRSNILKLFYKIKLS